MLKRRFALIFLPIIIGLSLGAFLFIYNADAGISADGNFTITPVLNNTDNLAGATSTRWTISATTTAELVEGDVIRFLLPTTTTGTPFIINNPTSTALSGIIFYKILGPGITVGVSSTIIEDNNRPAFYGYINATTTSGTAFSVTLGYVDNGSIASSSLVWTMEAGTLVSPNPASAMSVVKFTASATEGTVTATLPQSGSVGTSTISNLTLADLDTTGYGLDGRDFTVSWTPSSTWNASANGYASTKIYIVSSTANLTLNNVDSVGCGGSACVPVNMFNNYQMATATVPQFMQKDSAGQNWATSTDYVAWVYVVATTPFITSSSIANSTFDSPADVSAPQINHSPMHTAKESAAATVYAFVFDDQTTDSQFASPSGQVFFKLNYSDADGGNPGFVAATAVPNSGELYSFTIPTTTVVAAGGTFKYYLSARDAAGNSKFFCANPSAVSAGDCSASPFVVHTVLAGSRTVTGKITSSGANLASALVFANGWGGLITSTDGSGDYTIAGLPNNDVFDFTAVKIGYVKSSRMETIGTSNKTGINLSLNFGSFGFFEGSGGDAGGGGAPRVVFSGPPDGMQGVQTGEKIRVGFNQSMDASTINSVNTATSSDNVILMNTVTGTKVPGTVTYCANNISPGCSDLFSMDSNTILFAPTSALSTSTPYSLVINEKVKSQSGQQVQGNRTGGGHKINFTTVGNSFSFNAGQWTTNFQSGGQFLPPFVQSMSPAPGMSAASNAKVLLAFNQAMNSATINTTNVNLYSSGVAVVGTSVSLDSNEKRFVTISHSALSAGEYEVRVKGGAAAANGAPMRPSSSDVAFSSKFTSSGSADSSAPTVYPLLANNATGVSTDNIFEFGFNEQMAVDSITNSNITMSRGSTGVSVAVSYDPGKNSVFVTPDGVLVPNTVYTIVLSPSSTDLAGNALVTSTYTYTTGGVSTVVPTIKEARCDDYKCFISFTKSMNKDTQADANWVSSTINYANYSLTQGGPEKISASTVINYDAVGRSITLENVGLTIGTNFTLVITGVTDVSDNILASASVVGNTEDSKKTFGSFDGGSMFGPPTGDFMGGGGIGGGEFKPQGFGNFTADQFAFGQADMAFAMNPTVSQDVNVFHVRFNPGVALQNGDKIVIAFPDGTGLSGNTTFDTRSPNNTDYNQFGPGTVTGTAININTTTNKVTITLGVAGGTPTVNDGYEIDLSKITNPAIPKGPSTGGYTVGLQAVRGSTVLASKTSMPYFIQGAGSNSITIGVYVVSTSSPTAGANGTVYIRGGGPSGPMDKKLTLTDGAISAVDGVATTTLVYAGLNNGCYFVGTDPFVTLGANDYFGQMSPEPICVNSQNKTKNIILTASGGSNSVPVTVKLVKSGGFEGKDLDIFASGPGKFVVKTLTGVTTPDVGGYTLQLPANGHWNIGVGPAMSKGPTGGKSAGLGVMAPPPIDIVVSGLGGSATTSAGFFTPPGVTLAGGVITITFGSTGDNKTVAGTVKDVAGNGLSAIDVMINRQGFGTPMSTETNASGTFSLEVPVGTYEIGAMKDGMPPTFKSVDVRSDGNYTNGKLVTGGNPLILMMKKSSYSISGKVLDSSNNGISGASLFARDTNGVSVFGMTSSDGSYTLFVDNGTWNINVQMPPDQSDTCGSFSKTVVVASASQSSQNITPTAGTCVTLSGTVTAGGSTLNNVPLLVEEWSASTSVANGFKRQASTASDGTYSVKVLTNKTYRIGTMDPDYGELSATVAVVTDNATQDITMSADTISFAFTGGLSTMDAMVEMKKTSNTNQVIRKQIKGLNVATSINVENGAAYNYFIDVFGYGKFSGTITSTVGADTVTTNVGGSDYITVTGTIKDVSNNLLSGASVSLINTSTNMTASDLTDSSGVYELKIKAGAYQMIASLLNYVSPPPANVTFSANTGSYDFATGGEQSPLVLADHNIEGTTSGSVISEGYAWATNAAGAVVSAPINADGSYSLPVTNGTWTVKAVSPLHAVTTKTGTVTVLDADSTGNSIALTADATRVPTSTAGILGADTGGSVNDSGGSGIKMSVGKGVLETGSGDVTINLERNFSAPDSSSYKALNNATFSIEATGNSSIKELNGSAEIQLDYSGLLASLPDGVTESNLQMMYYSPERGDYLPVEGGYTVDTTNNTVTGLVKHFTDFVLAYVPVAVVETPAAPAAPASSSGSTSDTTPPTNASVVIAGGATSTLSTAVSLTLAATDATQMMIGNEALFTGRSWETYATTKTWTLTTNAGTKTVYVKFKDVAGNIGSVVSDTIVLTATGTVPVVIATTTPVIEPLKPIETIAPVVTAKTMVMLKPLSKLVIAPGIKASYQPGAKLKLNYQYKNEGKKAVTVKVMRQLVNAKNKVVKSVSVNKTIKAGATFKGVVDEALAKNLKAGEYTVKIKIMSAKNKLIEENGFKVVVEKLKSKVFFLGEVEKNDDSITFDEAVLAKVKSDVVLPVNLKVKYTYTNDTNGKQNIRMLRYLVDENGKVIDTKTGRWQMVPGEADSKTFIQAVAGNLSAGAYTVKIVAQDWKTKAILSENSVGFKIELK